MMSEWSPLPKMLHGRFLKAFVPFESLPKGKAKQFSSELQDIHPGDECFMFETNGDEWARGYVISQPLLSEFSAAAIDLNKIPERKVTLGVFPRSYVFTIGEISTEASPKQTDDSLEDVDFPNSVPTLYDTELQIKSSSNPDELLVPKSTALTKPNLPLIQLNDVDLLDEIVATLISLSSHIFTMYSINELYLFQRLHEIYLQLDDIRIDLQNNLLTKAEKTMAKKNATYLMGTIVKLLASRGDTNAGANPKSKLTRSDISGYQAIMSRSHVTGNLLDFQKDKINPAELVSNQLLFALSPNYPVSTKINADLTPEEDTYLKAVPTSHILVDVKNVSGSLSFFPKGYNGMTAYIFLRTSKTRLTEAFSIHIRPGDDLSLENLSAALFKNIPATATESGKIYLVAILTEGIDVASRSGKPVSLNQIRKGIAAGVTDVSRIFSRLKGSLAAGEAHQFIIKLFTSFITESDNSNSWNINNGWGELIERIITGSSRGVAVNPRAERLILSIKEFKNEGISDQSTLNNSLAIAPIRPLFYDPLSANRERIYIQLVNVTTTLDLGKTPFITTHLKASNKNYSFQKSSNEVPKDHWEFLTVAPGEYVNEIILLNNIPSKPRSSTSDYIIFTIFGNEEYLGEAKLLFYDGKSVFEDKKGCSIDIMSNDEVVGKVQVEVDYQGKVYNLDPNLESILNWKSIFANNFKANEESICSTLTKFGRTNVLTVVKYFAALVMSEFEIYEAALENELPTLSKVAFESIVHLLDVAIARQKSYIYLFDDFTRNYAKLLPKVAQPFLNQIVSIFENAEQEWSHVSRSLCRAIRLLLTLFQNMADVLPRIQLHNNLTRLVNAIAKFFSFKKDNLVSDQVLILSQVLHIRETLLLGFTPLNVCKDMITWFDIIGTRGLGTLEQGANVQNKPLSRERELVITKLILLNRMLHKSYNDDSDISNLLSNYAIHVSLEVLLGQSDVSASRLSSTILISVFSATWQKGDDATEQELLTIAQLLPLMSKIFNKYYKSYKRNDLQAKRVFTQLFQTSYPFTEHTVDSVVNNESFSELLLEFSTLLTFIVQAGQRLSDETGIMKVLEMSSKLQGKEPDILSSEVLLSILKTLKFIDEGMFYPKDKWLSASALFTVTSYGAFELIAHTMCTYYIPSVDNSESFDRLLWANFLRTLLKISTSMPVAIEHLTSIPAIGCLKITGDLRVKTAKLLENIWDKLAWEALPEDVHRFQLKRFGGYQVEFINYDFSCFKDLILLSLQKHESSREVGVKMLGSIIIAEWLISENLFDVERECILGCYEIYNSEGYRPSSEEQQLFIKRLKQILHVDPEDVAYKPVKKFVSTLAEFLEILNDLENVPLGDEFDDERTFHKLNISGYLMEVNSPEVLQSFINGMYEDNKLKENFVQAALSLELLANTYDWDIDTVLPRCYEPEFPAQTPFERKEALFKLIADNFAKGNRLEQAVDCYKELIEAYDKVSFDLRGLASAHAKLAKVYKGLEVVDRVTPSYFKISFIGLGFPTAIRGRQFIYEGLPFEHITSIHDRLSRLHPGVRIISEEEEAEKLIEEVPFGRFLHVKTVEPFKDLASNFTHATISMKRYMDNKDLKVFVSTRRLPGATGVTDLWTEETTYETYLTFPVLMNRSEIKSVKTVKISPLENAIRLLSIKNQDLATLELFIRHALKADEDTLGLFNDLSRQLAGTIDSPVNGGVTQYRVFFTSEEEAEDSFSGEEVKLLKSEFNDLVLLLGRCLILHGKLVSKSLKKSHDSLIDLFEQNFTDEIQELEIDLESIRNAKMIDTKYSDHLPNFRPSSIRTESIHSVGDNSRIEVSSGSLLSESSSRLTNLTDGTSRSAATRKRTALNWRRNRS
ncbi:hypothetical protein PP7435_CHR2-0687 [Komagataella phaffii CBS 7435]|uniref:DOCKER domain-containing protein n=2 Tax=Komagataella phaffii TaxID=460519 RepID=C4R162_KOMPG|nr:uncharacterized protein PAS_chr2-1_0599 [Komagataella phaffii GS115]AOA62872.1 GQ67_00655T0 [Komagataella phaffii]CAH2448238.1 hypothetical protein BQ9382_C2-3730 [Komagataella phaffii CBS 7435]AOA67715.1 GQ68_00733T0 [Komagataella phaffii GS115]CAY69236.1 Protein of unknown function with similarity to human DOCK proteins [Komagataella phaffii GS115]CCA38373.1 hypothetical protein PP7435_CHR2-0687 [Komagataella phaffii CBS 7435]